MPRKRQFPGPSEDLSILANRLVRLGRLLRASGSSAFACVGVGVGFLEARIIYALGNTPDLTAAVLAVGVGVDTGAASRILKALKERGLVTADSRRRLALTETGWKLWGVVAALTEELSRRLTCCFTGHEQELLFDFLFRLESALPSLSDQLDDFLDTLNMAHSADPPHGSTPRFSPLKNGETA
jgi:DNA-binding MarR family transcriptional regulator